MRIKKHMLYIGMFVDSDQQYRSPVPTSDSYILKSNNIPHVWGNSNAVCHWMTQAERILYDIWLCGLVG